MKRLISAVLASLEHSGIPYCLLHGGERLGDFPASDVDLVIRPRDLGRTEQLLYCQPELACVQLLKYKSTGICFTLASAEGQALSFLRLDLTTHYRGHGLLFMSAEEMLADRHFLNGIWVSSPAVEFSYLLVKKVLKAVVPPHQRQRLRMLAEQLGPEAAARATRYFGRKRSPLILSWISRADWGALEENLPLLKRDLLNTALLRRPAQWLRYWLPELWRLGKRWLHPAGLFIAVLGPDGSGKSTLLHHLPAILRPAFPRDAAFHLRPGFLPAAGKGGPKSDPHGEAQRSGFTSLLKLAYLILDCNLGYLFKVRSRLARASLVCFDRYFHDLLADPLRYRHRGPPWLLRAACRLIPRPDLFLILDVPESELLKRKQEVPRSEVERQRAAYRSLAAELPNALLLPAQDTESLTAVRAAEALLSYLQWRYSRHRHLWFPSSSGADWNWLTSVLCSRESGERPAGPRKLREEFWRLSLRDGRGYLLPLAPPRSAAVALRLYGAQSAKARAARSCLAAGLATGLIQHLLPRPAEEREGTPCADFLPDHLMRILGREDLSFAISLGTPGTHRKPVVQVIEKSGRSLAFAKIGWNPATRELVGNEAQVLQSLQAQNPHNLCLPALLHLGRWHDRLICLQSTPAPNAKQASQVLSPSYLAALHELAALDSRRLPLGESAFWKSLGGWRSRMEGSWPGYALLARLDLVGQRLGAREWPFHFCHGDFVPWNALMIDGRPFLFDWEYARAQWLPGYDLLHFLFQTRLLLARKTAASIYWSVLKRITRSAELKSYWQKLHIEEAELPFLIQLYLLDRAIYHAYVSPGHFWALQRILALAEISFTGPGLLP